MRQILTNDSEYPVLSLQLRTMDLELKNSTIYETKKILDDLASSNSESLEGFAVSLLQNQNNEISHLDLLLDTILKPEKVTQIVINIHKSIHGRSSMVEPAHKTAAEELTNAAPYLRINICWSFWRICRRIKFEGKNDSGYKFDG